MRKWILSSKSLTRKVYTEGVQLSTHKFFQFFGSFFLPLSSGRSVFLPCVLVPGAHETRGGARFFWGGPNTGGRASSGNFFLRNAGGKWASNMLPPIFFAQGRFLGYFRWQQQGRHGKKRSRRRRKRRSRRRRGRRMTRRRIGTKRNEKKKGTKRKEKKKKKKKKKKTEEEKQRKKNNKEEAQ